MNEIIPISYEKDVPTVSGRELHAALEVETRYSDWFPRLCEYGFIEGKDHYSILSNGDGFGKAAFRADHSVTIQMAKELCMLQRTAKGKQFREYFIRAEQAWNDPDKIVERAFQIMRQRALASERRIMALEERNEALEVALNVSDSHFTVMRYNTAFKKNWSMAQCQGVGKCLSMYCRANGIKILKCSTNDERFGSVNSYPVSAWETFMRTHPNIR
jgi:anti-repressor protein